jgi:hypothetical protein
MRGPYPLSPLAVEQRVPCHVRGVYCLAKVPGGPVVKVFRAEADLREELKTSATDYRAFWYETCIDNTQAYKTECWMFHRYSSTATWGNQVHPTAPPKTQVTCPVCGK